MCEVHDIPNDIKTEIIRMIRSFIWENKHNQRSIEGLEVDYLSVGFRFGSIDKKYAH